MAFKTLATLFASLALASSRDSGKLMRTIPTISNSLVNLGKMEISFHFNGKPSDFETKHEQVMEVESSPVKSLEQSCACADFKPPGKSILSHPTEIINKILRSNSLFKDPTSTVCCGSDEHQEHVQESTVFVELVPNHVHQNNNVQRNSAPLFSFPHFEKMINKASATKPKAVEVLLFPKRKDMVNFEFPSFMSRKKENMPRVEFQILGNREQSSLQSSTSVKKDLALTEKKNLQAVVQDEVKTVTPANNLATDNNAL